MKQNTFQSTNSLFWVVTRRDWDLAIPVGYWSTQENFCAVEELVGKAQLETTSLAKHEAGDAEVYQTLNVHERVDWADKGHKFQWWKSLSVTERTAV